MRSRLINSVLFEGLYLASSLPSISFRNVFGSFDRFRISVFTISLHCWVDTNSGRSQGSTAALFSIRSRQVHSGTIGLGFASIDLVHHFFSLLLQFSVKFLHVISITTVLTIAPFALLSTMSLASRVTSVETLFNEERKPAIS